MGLNRKARRAALKARRGGDEMSMSDMLIDIAQPLLHTIGDDDLEVYQAALETAADLWNALRLPGVAGPEQAIREFKGMVDVRMPDELDGLLREVLERAARYPQVDRMIDHVEVVPEPGGRLRINVLSRLSSAPAADARVLN